MAGDIGGWSVSALSGANTPITAEKVGAATKQHVVYGFDVSFSSAPSSPVLAQLINPDVSPNTVYWEGYFSIAGVTPVRFEKGITFPAGAGVTLSLAAGGSSVHGAINLHGTTR